MVADVDRDAAAGVVTMATAWGRRRAWLVHAVLLGTALVGIALGLVALGGRPLGAALVGIGGGLVLAGAVALRPPRAVGAGHALGWELEATGVAVAGAGWLAAIVL
jgi:4-hydroxybenzoate polyprenyltransferase